MADVPQSVDDVMLLLTMIVRNQGGAQVPGPNDNEESLLLKMAQNQLDQINGSGDFTTP